jgi:hypothetical protein
MQAIITKFLGPTNTKGARIKATSWDGSITIAYPYNGDVGHIQAAQCLIAKLQSPEDISMWRLGAMPDGSGFAFVKGE